jgi:hypothetical protein
MQRTPYGSRLSGAKVETYDLPLSVSSWSLRNGAVRCSACIGYPEVVMKQTDRYGLEITFAVMPNKIEPGIINPLLMK